MSQHSKKRPRTLIPKTSNRYRVRVLTPTSFTIENLRKPTKRSPENPARTAELKKANIEQVVNELLGSSDKRAKIFQWAQEAENLVSQKGQRSPRMIDVREAASMFCRRLLEDDPSALALLQRLRVRKGSIIDRWEKEASESIIDEQADKWLKAWLEVDGPKLTPQQHQIIEVLGVQRQHLYSGGSQQTKDLQFTGDALKFDVLEAMGGQLKDYDTQVCHAIRSGLQDHPWCLEWIIQHLSSGDRKSLHRLHRSHPKLESGVLHRRSMAGEEATVLQEILRLRTKDGKLSLRSIHRILQTHKLYMKPWSTFQKWISNPLRLEFIDPTP